MTLHIDDNPLADDAPLADAVEQRQPADLSAADDGLDTAYLANLGQRDANPADVIDQAAIVAWPHHNGDTLPDTHRLSAPTHDLWL
jgi:hypothetical protein